MTNIGTGKIYGDHLSTAAGTVNNDSEIVGGTTTAATLAARDCLDLGVSVPTTANARWFSARVTRSWAGRSMSAAMPPGGPHSSTMPARPSSRSAPCNCPAHASTT